MLFDSAQLDAEGLLDLIGADIAHKHSAGYLEQRNRRLFNAIALALGYGIPVQEIARRCNVGENTVRAVGFKAAGSVEDTKQELKQNLRKFLHGASMILIEKIEEIPVEKLPAAIAAINQQLLLLDGQATSITRHETAGTLDDVAAQITAAQEAARQARGRVVDEAPETGLALTNNPPGGMVLTDADPVGQLIARLAADPAAQGLADGGPASANAMIPPLEEGQDGALSGALYQSGQDGDQGSHEAGPAVEGGGGGGGARGGEKARYIEPV